MSPVILLLVSISCAVVGARLFGRSECPKNAVGNCMTSVQEATDDVAFCKVAATAVACATEVMKVCFSMNDPEFLDSLSNYDIVGVHQKMLTLLFEAGSDVWKQIAYVDFGHVYVCAVRSESNGKLLNVKCRIKSQTAKLQGLIVKC